MRTHDGTGTTHASLTVLKKTLRRVNHSLLTEYFRDFSKIIDEKAIINLIIICKNNGKFLKQFPQTHPRVSPSYVAVLAEKKPDVGKIEIQIPNNDKYDTLHTNAYLDQIYYF